MSYEKFRGVFPPKMLAFMEEYLGDKRPILYPKGNLLKRVVDLSNVLNASELEIQGDFLYADRNSTGILNVAFNSTSMPPFPFARHTSIKGFPFDKVYLTSPGLLQQVGLSITLWYGFGAEIIPFAQDTGENFIARLGVGEPGQSGIVVSNAAVNIRPPNAFRRYLEIYNHDAALDLYLNISGSNATADANSILVPPRTSWKPAQGGAMPVNNISGIRNAVNAAISVTWVEGDS
jgi:hypothetical protein